MLSSQLNRLVFEFRFFQLWVLLVVQCIAFDVMAREWYVAPASKAGNGSGLSIDSPWHGFSKIRWGYNGISSGDTLNVLPGLYQESLFLSPDVYAIGDIRISCIVSGKCIIDGQFKRRIGIFVKEVDNVTVQGMVIRSHKNSGVRYLNASGVKIKECILLDNLHYGVYVAANKDVVMNVDLSSNTAFNNGSKRPQDRSVDAGIYVTASKNGFIKNVIIRNNKSYNNGRFGIVVYPKNTGSVENVLIGKNITYENGASGIDLSKRVVNAKIETNVSYGNGTRDPGAAIHIGGVKKYAAEKIQIIGNFVGLQHLHKKDGAGILIDDYVSNVIVSGNISVNNQESGIKLHNSSDVLVSNNLIVNNPKGVHTPSSDNYIIKNNTIVGSSLFGVLVASTATDAEVSNNIILDGNVGVRNLIVRGRAEVSRNCLYNNELALKGKNILKMRERNYFTAPTYQKLAPGSYCVKPGSLCGNSGVDYKFNEYHDNWFQLGPVALRDSVEQCDI